MTEHNNTRLRLDVRFRELTVLRTASRPPASVPPPRVSITRSARLSTI